MSDAETLAARAVACKGWRWLPGMLMADVADAEGADAVRICAVEAPRAGDPVWWAEGVAAIGAAFQGTIHGHHVPDLADPATLGCLLALLREAWGDPAAFAMRMVDDGWATWAFAADGPGGKQDVKAIGPTEAAALVAALERAP